MYDVSINENRYSQSYIALSPNPNTGNFRIELPEAAYVQVFNATGASVYQSASERGTVNIHLEHLPPRLYYLKTRSGTAQAFTRFIKQ
jgi:hypothetical protein